MLFNRIKDYKDAKEQIDQCKREQEALIKRRKRFKMCVVLVVGVVVVVCFIFSMLRNSKIVHAHEYEIVQSQEASCVNAGFIDQVCKICGAEKHVELETLEHDCIEATCMEPKTCRACGTAFGSVSNHDYLEATCSEPKTCKLCGKTFGNALGHNVVGTKCTRCGNVVHAEERLQLHRGVFRITCTKLSGDGFLEIGLEEGSGGSYTVLFYHSDIGESVKTVVYGPIDGRLIVDVYNGTADWDISIEELT